MNFEIADYKKFSISKIGEESKENKDSVEIDAQKGIFCISDGVSGASFSGQWARLLTENFLKNPFTVDIDEKKLALWIGPIQKNWWDHIPWEELLEKKPYEFTEKAQDGASATFLGGIILVEENKTLLKMWAIGDSNLFVIRDEEILVKFPIDKSDDFTIDPSMVFSISKTIEGEIKCKNGPLLFRECELKKNDTVIVATDSLSKWFLESFQNDRLEPWATLKEIKNTKEFTEFVEEKEKNKYMRNDDFTLLIITI